jgi:hypothetical protein
LKEAAILERTLERKTAYREFRSTASPSAVALLRAVNAQKTVPQ